MRKSSKKSTVKSKSKKRKNPLKKYQTAGVVTPTVGATGAALGTFGSGTLGSSGFDSATLGSDSYLSSPTSTTNTYNSQFGDSFSSPYGSDFSSTPNSSYSGLDAGLNTDPFKPRTLTEFNVDENTNLSQTARNQANVMNAEYKADPLKVSRKMQDDDIARSVVGALPGAGGVIAAATKRTSIDDPNRYYSRRVKSKLESYNKKINTSAAMSSVGQSIMGAGTALIGAIGPFAAIPIAAGAIWTAASEGAKASYEGDQKEFGAEYDQLVANRQRTERRAKAQREKNEEMNQQQYFQQAPSPNAGIDIVRDGGMIKYQVGGLKREAPLEEVDVMDPAMDVLMNGGFSGKQKSALRTIEQKYGPEIRDRVIMADRISKTGGNTAGTPVQKYMGGGYTKVNGPSHEDGGVAMDLDADGVVDSELEGGEIIEEMKHGGNASKKYIWSDHLKTGGMSFAKKFEQERKRGATPRRIEKLRVEQELAAKRDPSKLYAKYGGMMKYGYGGKMEYMKEGGKLPKEVLESRLESHMSEGEAQDYIDSYKGGGLWANIHAKRKRIAGGSGEQMRKPGSKGAPTAKALRESKRDGGLMKYQLAGLQRQKFVSPFATPAEERAFQDYANAQEAGVTNGYGWGSRSAAAYDKYGNQYDFDSAEARIRDKRGYNDIKNNSSLPRNEAWEYEVKRGDEFATRPPQAFLNEQYAKNQKLKTRQQTLKNLKGGFNEYAGGAAALLGAGARAAALGSIDPNERPPSMSARDVKAAEVSIDRARVNRGVIESELINAKRGINMTTGPKTAALNSARMVSLRALEEAEMDAYEQNRLASAQEQLANQKAQLEAYGLNQGKDLKTSESISRIMDKVIDTRRNQTIAGGEIAAQSMKDFQSWKANQDLTRAMEGDRNVMSNFYNNNYPAFARKFKKGNPNATALEINQAFLASV